jgi:hypothetical protein
MDLLLQASRASLPSRCSLRFGLTTLLVSEKRSWRLGKMTGGAGESPNFPTTPYIVN